MRVARLGFENTVVDPGVVGIAAKGFLLYPMPDSNIPVVAIVDIGIVLDTCESSCCPSDVPSRDRSRILVSWPGSGTGAAGASLAQLPVLPEPELPAAEVAREFVACVAVRSLGNLDSRGRGSSGTIGRGRWRDRFVGVPSLVSLPPVAG